MSRDKEQDRLQQDLSLFVKLCQSWRGISSGVRFWVHKIFHWPRNFNLTKDSHTRWGLSHIADVKFLISLDTGFNFLNLY